ncbi:MAG: SUMF1/EgtB/PvdO family nonheme iron enzyme [Planctomycetes bacterium]|nr:SUMF1/EgtB/PvdO family nonheme iron enzyme [Planctomycetota bacterium]
MSRSSSLGMFFLAVALIALCGPAAEAQRPTGNKGDKGINVEPVLSPKSGQFRALLIGVNDYTRLKDLKYCEADVTALRDRLVAMGFRRDAIKCLTTGDRDPARRPSYRNITEHLDALFSGLKEDAVLVIALSGHGGSFEWKDASGKVQKASFYCPQDARLHDPLRTMISTKDIFDRLEKCPARFKLLLVDACRDAHFAPDGARTAIDEAKSMAAFAKSLSDPSTLPKGTLAMISCASGEQSYEDPKLGHGIFMYYVLQGLAGKADVTYRGDRNKIVSYRELADYVYRKTSDHAWAKHTRRQTPKFYAKWEQRDFDLVEVQETGPPKDFTNRIAMKFKLIPAGEFMMGSPESEKFRYDDEGPVHRVKLTKPFYLGVHEVTQGEFEKVMGTSPWKGKNFVKEGSDYPASYISWDDAVEFCKKLSAKEGRTYRLPTEAEWEYACRAGSKTAHSFGADSSKLGAYAWCNDNTAKIGEYYAHLVG